MCPIRQNTVTTTVLQFYNSVKGFKDVRVFTGHAHTNYTVSYLNMTEYNVGAIGGNLWWTGYFVNGNSASALTALRGDTECSTLQARS